MSLPRFRSNRPSLNRRNFLRGLGGSAIALPFLESLAIRRARANPAAMPPRMVYFWFDLGVYRDTWIPRGGSGPLNLPPLLQDALGPHRNELLVVKHLRNYYGDSHGEGPGDHARSVGTFLTCAHHRYGTQHDRPRAALPAPPNGRPRRIRDGESHYAYDADVFTQPIEGSADQVAARLPWNQAYSLSSLQVKNGGGGDSYHSDVMRHLSWTDTNRPAPRFETPRQIFDQLFANRTTSMDDGPDPGPTLDRSILDTVVPAVARLNRRLGRRDRLRLDRYLSEVRDLESKIAEAEDASGHRPARRCELGDAADYPANRIDFRRHIDLTLELLVKAFECDLTRIATYGMPWGGFGFRRDAQGRTLSKQAHNFYSHHGDNPEARDGLMSISTFWTEKLSDFLTAMKDRTDPDGRSLLHHSMVMFGCGMMDGNSHNSHRGSAQLPVILAGGASGAWTPGRQIDLGGPVKLADVHLNMLRNMGHTADRFGDGDGTSVPL